eukprot:Hpha_TRINITY_DN4022_c0_g1::TRINITY_DN4022_c0_g1_i1::g.63797::m.63797/K08515/VAMP7; vesicle-associated membrane protein 7
MADIHAASIGVAGSYTVLAKVESKNQKENSAMTQLIAQLKGRSTRDTVSVEDFVIHYIVADGIVFCAITGAKDRLRLAFSFLEKVHTTFQQVYGGGGGAIPPDPDSLTPARCKKFVDTLKKEVKWYNDPQNDKATAIQKTVDDTRDIMASNIDQILQRGEKIDDLAEQAAVLNSETVTFKKKATQIKRKACYQHYRMCLIVILIVLALIVLAFFAICKFDINNKPCSWIFGDGDSGSGSGSGTPVTASPTTSAPSPKLPIVVNGGGLH